MTGHKVYAPENVVGILYTCSATRSDGGAWSTQFLNFSTNATGDYDPLTNAYMVSVNGNAQAHRIDVANFAQTTFIPAGGARELRRSGAILAGVHYDHTGSNLLFGWDIDQPALPPVAVPGPIGFYASMAAAADEGLLCINDYNSGALVSYDPVTGVFSNLGSALGGHIGHSSIAYAGTPTGPSAMSELAALGLFGLRLAGLGLAARRRRG